MTFRMKIGILGEFFTQKRVQTRQIRVVIKKSPLKLRKNNKKWKMTRKPASKIKKET